jgi:subtilisin family serine protease
MEQDAFKSRWKFATVLTIALVVALAVTPALTQAAGKARLRSSDVNRTLALHGTQITDDKGRIEMFVRLDEPAVAELNAQSIESTGQFASPEAQRAQAQRVSAQHARIRPLITGSGVEILSSQRVGANGFRVRGRPAEIASLRSLQGVRSVARVELHTLNNIDSVPWIGAPAVWASVGRGEGVKIGIIDSGIDYTHADFGGSGNPSDYAGNNPNIVEPGTFPTAKVKGGYDFVGATYDGADPTSIPVPDNDPLDLGGHGTHVAGTAAGIGVAGSVGPGVAPGASLYALKVFGDAGGSTDVTSLAIEWAMDPNGDGDMSDHLDVINMSLGAPFGEPDDPSSISSNNAAAVGIIVAIAAGNEGNVPYIMAAPGVASSAIAAAANSPGGRLYSRFRVTSPASVAGIYPSLEGTGPVTLAQAGPISGPLVPGTPANGCAPLTNAAAVSGKVALIIRGACDFTVKYLNAQAAGARVIVVYNDGTAPDRIDPLVMGAEDPRITIPGLMISYTAGASLVAAANVNVTIDVALDPTQNDKTADFSSRGPGQGGSTFKPDLSAPGVAIVSAGAGTGTGSLNLQGTSMATPHVAGAAALLRQKHPKLSPAAIKAIMQNSTVDANVSGDTDLMRQGVGALRIDRAVALTSYAAPAGVSFGRLNPLAPISRNEKVTLKDISGSRRNFTVTHVPHQTFPGVEVNCPTNLRLVGNGAATFLITLKFDPRVAWREGIFDNAVTSQTEVDGWCILKDGKDTLRVGYVAVVDPASGVVVLPASGLSGVKVRNLGPSLGWAEAFTLAKLGGEEQNGTYGSIAATGFRRAPNPARYAPFKVLELGFVMERAFEHLSNLTFELAIDTDGDNVQDLFLIGTDLSNLIGDEAPGQFVTAQIGATDAFIDWEANDWDFNDRTLFLPFTLASTGGLVPEKFNYVLTVTTRNGEQDVQHGSVDLSKEIVPDINSFGVDPGDNIDVALTGPTGTSLWLLQNNIPLAQPALSLHIAKKK